MVPKHSRPNSDSDAIKATERERVRALVNAEIEVMRHLHADDYELITPLGAALSKEQ
jgi:hypothetical protein